MTDGDSADIPDEWESAFYKKEIVHPPQNAGVNRYLVVHRSFYVDTHCNKFDDSITEYHLLGSFRLEFD